MRPDSNAATNIVGDRRRSRAKNEASSISSPTDTFLKNFQNLTAKAAKGDFQSQFRLEAIIKLADPHLYFYESDVRRILKKGYSPQVEKGLKLFRLMSSLRIFCEPTGDTIGVACRVRQINFEKLTLNGLLDIKGQATGLMSRAAMTLPKGERFNGLELLRAEEKVLYRKVKQFFGKRKRPTLKRIALDILGEEDELYSERNSLNYLAAARGFHLRYKQESGSSLYYIESVDSFNQDRRTGREMFAALWLSAYRNFESSLIPVRPQLANIRLKAAQPLAEALARVLAGSQPATEAIARALTASSKVRIAGLAQSISE